MSLDALAALEDHGEFARRHIAPTEADIAAMLSLVKSISPAPPPLCDTDHGRASTSAAICFQSKFYSKLFCKLSPARRAYRQATA